MDNIFTGCRTLLYVGAGYRTNAHFNIIHLLDEIPIKVALDLDQNKLDSWRFQPGWTTVCGDATKLDELFEGCTFDAIVGIDFIEHLTKENADTYLKLVDACCNKVSLLITPEGFLDTTVLQAEHVHSDLDVHKSGWEIVDFQDYGYHAYALPEYRHRFANGEEFRVLWATKEF